MDRNIKEDFQGLREFILEIVSIYDTFKRLFSQENVILLQQPYMPGYLFRLIQDMLYEYWILQSCKIFDSASFRGRSNLSIRYINNCLRDLNLFDKKLEDLSKKLCEFYEKIKPSRDRIISHSDLTTYQHRLHLSELKSGEIDEFIEGIKKYSDIIGEKIGLGITPEIDAQLVNDTEILIDIFRQHQLTKDEMTRR